MNEHERSKFRMKLLPSPTEELRKQLAALGFQMQRQYKEISDKLTRIEKKIDNIDHAQKFEVE